MGRSPVTHCERYAEVAALVRQGEWTSYGDISAAVHGTPRRARAVGQAAATFEEFPNAHRVLSSQGTISRGAAGSEDARRAGRRLGAEGVAFDGSGKADPARRVHWDELARRSGRRPRRVSDEQNDVSTDVTGADPEE